MNEKPYALRTLPEKRAKFSKIIEVLGDAGAANLPASLIDPCPQCGEFLSRFPDEVSQYKMQGIPVVLCVACFYDRQIEFLARPDVTVQLEKLGSYARQWDLLTNYFGRQIMLKLANPPGFGIYMLSMTVTDQAGQEITAAYIGKSSFSLQTRLLKHKEAFALAILGTLEAAELESLAASECINLGLREFDPIYAKSPAPYLRRIYEDTGNYELSRFFNLTSSDRERTTRVLKNFVLQFGMNFDLTILEEIDRSVPDEIFLRQEKKWQDDYEARGVRKLWIVRSSR